MDEEDTVSKDSPYGDWRVILLKGATLVLDRPIVRPLVRAFTWIFLTISPSVPVDFRRGISIAPARELFFVSYGLAFFFCFAVTAGLCLVEGTFQGTLASRRYFLQDGWNIVLYVFVCPTYVALSCSLIGLTIREWSLLADYADAKATPDTRRRSSKRLYAVFFLALLICTAFITNYMHDILNPAPEVASVARLYWFMGDTGSIPRSLNRVGYYYLVLNFALLFITLVGCACFLSLAAEVLRAGSANTVDKIDSFEALQVKLESFTRAYLLTKGLAAAYAVNVVVWAVSPLGKTDNLLLAQIALTIVGVFFVAVPRQYIELKWFELWQSSKQPFEYAETRSWKIKATASVLDAFFIAAIMSVWKLDLPGFSERLTKWLSPEVAAQLLSP